MTRPIKFRAWDIENKRMINSVWEIGFGVGDSQEWLVGDDRKITTFELMQFTGLLDNNGKEIYEGDILLANKAWFELASNVGIVGSSGEKFVVHDASWDNWDFIQNRTTEVIGNIYQNSDLL